MLEPVIHKVNCCGACPEIRTQLKPDIHTEALSLTHKKILSQILAIVPINYKKVNKQIKDRVSILKLLTL